jgi:hypothetical protein
VDVAARRGGAVAGQIERVAGLRTIVGPALILWSNLNRHRLPHPDRLIDQPEEAVRRLTPGRGVAEGAKAIAGQARLPRCSARVATSPQKGRDCTGLSPVSRLPHCHRAGLHH